MDKLDVFLPQNPHRYPHLYPESYPGPAQGFEFMVSAPEVLLRPWAFWKNDLNRERCGTLPVCKMLYSYRIIYICVHIYILYYYIYIYVYT
jgi:hypothetical protein